MVKRCLILFVLVSFIPFVACEKDSTNAVVNNDNDDDNKAEEDLFIIDASKVFTHPGLLHSQNDFNRVKTKVEAQEDPWISGWQTLIDNSHSSATYNMQGPTVKLIRGGNSLEEPEYDNYSKAFNDVAAAYQNALRWKVTGDEAHAEKAIEILNAWAVTCERISGDPNKALAAGIYGYQFANAAEIMRDYEGWKAEDFATFQQWMLDVFYPVSYDYLETQYNVCSTYIWSNWDLCNLANIMSIAVLCDRVDLYQYVFTYLKSGIGNGQLSKLCYYVHEATSNDDIDLCQLQESGRDQGHALLSVGLIGTICQMAYSQGEDLYGYNDNIILKGAEYEAKYNAAWLSVPFKKYSNCNDETHTVVSDEGRGEKRPIWEMLYNHYVVRKGITARYVTVAAKTHRSEGGGGDYGPNSGGFDALGFGTLMYSLQ